MTIDAEIDRIFLNLYPVPFLKPEGDPNGIRLDRHDFPSQYAVIIIFLIGFKSPVEFYLKRTD